MRDARLPSVGAGVPQRDTRHPNAVSPSEACRLRPPSGVNPERARYDHETGRTPEGPNPEPTFAVQFQEVT